MELERGGFIYSTNLDKYKDHGMPWMEKVMSPLPDALEKTPNIRMRVLTFLSCVGMIMNGNFIDFNHLRSLLTDMSQTYSQKILQQLQSWFMLPKVFNAYIWRLQDIPYRLVQKPPAEDPSGD